ncbi:MAG: hypothetical protein AAB402_01460 [Patescibacteria group bacterium]
MNSAVHVSAPLGSSRLADAAVKIIVERCHGIASITIGPAVEADQSVTTVSYECRQREATVIVTLPVTNGFRRLIVAPDDALQRKQLAAEMLVQLQSAHLPVETIRRTEEIDRHHGGRFKRPPGQSVPHAETPPLPDAKIDGL